MKLVFVGDQVGVASPERREMTVDCIEVGYTVDGAVGSAKFTVKGTVEVPGVVDNRSGVYRFPVGAHGGNLEEALMRLHRGVFLLGPDSPVAAPGFYRLIG